MGGIVAHLVHVLLSSDVSLFGGLAPTCHFLYDGSVTSRLMSGWSLLVCDTSFSMHLCIDLGLTGRPAFSSVLRPRFLLPFLPRMLDHPRCLHRPIFLLDGNMLSVCRGSIKNKAIFFFNWPPYFFIFSHCLQFQKTQKQEKSRITT